MRIPPEGLPPTNLLFPLIPVAPQPTQFYPQNSDAEQPDTSSRLRGRSSNWTEEQNRVLKEIYEKHKRLRKPWQTITDELNAQLNTNFQQKSVSQHYSNCLVEGQEHRTLTEAEKLTLDQAVEEHGKKWSYISKNILPHLSSNRLKNSWNLKHRPSKENKTSEIQENSAEKVTKTVMNLAKTVLTSPTPPLTPSTLPTSSPIPQPIFAPANLLFSNTLLTTNPSPIESTIVESPPQQKTPSQKRKRAHWKFGLDAKLQGVVSTYTTLYGKVCWPRITELFNEEASVNFTPKQVYAHYTEYLRPGYTQAPLTKEERTKLAELVVVHGTRWVELTQYFEGHSAQKLKNTWNTQPTKQLLPSTSSSAGSPLPSSPPVIPEKEVFTLPPDMIVNAVTPHALLSDDIATALYHFQTAESQETNTEDTAIVYDQAALQPKEDTQVGCAQDEFLPEYPMHIPSSPTETSVRPEWPADDSLEVYEILCNLHQH